MTGPGGFFEKVGERTGVDPLAGRLPSNPGVLAPPACTLLAQSVDLTTVEKVRVKTTGNCCIAIRFTNSTRENYITIFGDLGGSTPYSGVAIRRQYDDNLCRLVSGKLVSTSDGRYLEITSGPNPDSASSLYRISRDGSCLEESLRWFRSRMEIFGDGDGRTVLTRSNEIYEVLPGKMQRSSPPHTTGFARILEVGGNIYGVFFNELRVGAPGRLSGIYRLGHDGWQDVTPDGFNGTYRATSNGDLLALTRTEVLKCDGGAWEVVGPAPRLSEGDHVIAVIQPDIFFAHVSARNCLVDANGKQLGPRAAIGCLNMETVGGQTIGAFVVPDPMDFYGDPLDEVGFYLRTSEGCWERDAGSPRFISDTITPTILKVGDELVACSPNFAVYRRGESGWSILDYKPARDLDVFDGAAYWISMSNPQLGPVLPNRLMRYDGHSLSEIPLPAGDSVVDYQFSKDGLVLNIIATRNPKNGMGELVAYQIDV